jgi:hypothetical protein
MIKIFFYWTTMDIIIIIIIGGSLIDIHSFITTHQIRRPLARDGNKRRHIAKC